ncbi:hypothetical protein BDW22DRAFT_517938 [Trametopsis cervina]|nr:hypothetical protein BDW22DRAFT_517938 [Trametopsis cervina]
MSSFVVKSLQTQTGAAVCETFVYGAFSAVVVILLHTVLTSSRVELSATRLRLILCAFVLSSVHCASSVVSLVTSIVRPEPYGPRATRDVLNALIQLNFLFADGVVVWRMRVLCTLFVPSWVLLIPVSTLAATSLCVFLTMGLRVAIMIIAEDDRIDHGPVLTSLNVIQVSVIGLSLLSNISATTIIGYWAWRWNKAFPREDRSHGPRATTGERVLFLLFESGCLYCASTTILLIGTPIRVINGTVGDIYKPLHVQFSVSHVHSTLRILKHC